jgi:hypothetical protein
MMNIEELKAKFEHKMVKRPRTEPLVSRPSNRNQEFTEPLAPIRFELDFEVIDFDTQETVEPTKEFKLFSSGLREIHMEDTVEETVQVEQKMDYDSDEEAEIRRRCSTVAVTIHDIKKEAVAYEKRQSAFIADEPKIYPRKLSRFVRKQNGLKMEQKKLERLNAAKRGRRGRGGFRGTSSRGTSRK